MDLGRCEMPAIPESNSESAMGFVPYGPMLSCKNDDEACVPTPNLVLLQGRLKLLMSLDPYLDCNPCLDSCRVLPLWVCCPMRRGEKEKKRLN